MKNGYSFKNNSVFSCIWTVIYPILLYLFASFVVGFLAVFVLIPFYGVDANVITEKLNDNIMLVNIFCQVVCIALFLPIFLHSRKYFPKVKEKVSLKYILISGIMVMGIGIISGVLSSLLDVIFSNGDLQRVNSTIMSGGILVTFISTVILAPIMEELMLRGIILNKLLSKMNKWWAIVISALVFGFIHLNLVQGINAFILGIFLALAYVKCRSIIPCMIGHGLNNLLSVICSLITMNNNFVDTPVTIAIQVVCLVISILPMYLFFKYKGVEVNEE